MGASRVMGWKIQRLDRINLQAVFEQYTRLERCYLTGAPVEHDILLILENVVIGGEAMLSKGLVLPKDHLSLIRNVLRIAYQVGKYEGDD